MKDPDMQFLNQTQRERALSYDNNMLYAKVMRLEAYIIEVRAALRSFAAIKADDGDNFDAKDYPPDIIIQCEVTAGDIHHARKILSHDWKAP